MNVNFIKEHIINNENLTFYYRDFQLPIFEYNVLYNFKNYNIRLYFQENPKYVATGRNKYDRTIYDKNKLFLQINNEVIELFYSQIKKK
ncbi:hypothetical protein [Mycoplasma crocodyli]|uniref:Uncharacterized protein n=1 Tax=Mycoplasma crocodyli (strain ATCC 51981 / MP145) TaxID=512564 RepID=D5E5W9_MYCCM|nr:hypothetical protein [Mycoplasma crocodyli]ADE19691.1 conserved hypothetical protein [Mycoplasma crocodyli MP145]